MNNEVIWAIRDAQGLNSKEKVFLFVTESRGELYGKWRRNATDMGLSKNHYYEARKSLLDKGLLLAVRRMDDTTVYVVNHDAFPYQESDSHGGNDDSCIGNDDSRIGETKKNIKNNMKEELEEEQLPDAAAPVVDFLPNDEVKGESPMVDAHGEPAIAVPLITGNRHAAAASVYTKEEELRQRRARVLSAN